MVLPRAAASSSELAPPAYFVELPRYKASASLELTPGSSRNQMI